MDIYQERRILTLIKAAFMFPHPPIIVPEIGKGEEKKIQKTVEAYHAAARQIAGLKPEAIIQIISIYRPEKAHRGILRSFERPKYRCRFATIRNL